MLKIRLRFPRVAMALIATGLLAATTTTVKAADAPVTITQDSTTYVLDNGIVTVRVAKASGDLLSIRYKNQEMLATKMGADGLPDLKADPPGQNDVGFGPFTDHQYGFWSHDAMGPRSPDSDTTHPLLFDTITIDPASNGGSRGEVSVKGISNGRKMGTGPGSNANGNFISDIEIRYALGQGESGVYTYCIFDHPAKYGATQMTEARFCFKLNNFFDWMLVSPQHNKLYLPESRENKYDYTTDQFEHPAYGWASTSKQIGCFIVNPSVEYLSGGPTKIEFLCHRDTNQVSAPCILNYWRSSHYGGAVVNIAANQDWRKVIGPFLLYVNSGQDPQGLWKDAIDQQAKEAAKWPFDWVNGIDYPHHDQRATVSGHLNITDPLAPSGLTISHVLVGLATPAFKSDGVGPGGPQTIDWQRDAMHYEFWVHGDDNGTFSIPNVRPGTYTLHAMADGILGEYAKTDVTVTPGQALNLGDLAWTPVRSGRQVWDIGIPNRNGSEFLKGDDYFHDGMAITYAQLFPNDVHYVVGQSDYRKDWFFCQVPHADAAAIAAGIRPVNVMPTAPPTQPTTRGARGGGRGRGPAPARGAATPWTIEFQMPAAPTSGVATLRIALSATGTNSIDVAVNGQPAGKFDRLQQDATFGMGNGIQGLWYERALPFDATALKAGANTITLTVPAGPLTAGVVYDYLRLELNETASIK